ncbi:hypothetical protein A0256_23430 [Mucilaginibacter sp. PAMC 26640]|nr:hypothetical protein A0256_23430 [Mucilaginibacter sp. PAMC 26640]
MSNTVKERILDYIKHIGIDAKTFELKADLGNGFVSKTGFNIRRTSIDKIKLAFSDLNTEWLLSGNGNMLINDDQSIMTIKNHKKKDALIPFYNADFIAGNAELYYADETIYPEYYMDVPEFSGSVAFRAYGDSMEPRIKSGSILFGVKRDNWGAYLEFGQIYGITCRDGSRYLKYIRKHIDKEFLLFKSENPNYDDMDMPKSEIKNIWLITGWIDKRT